MEPKNLKPITISNSIWYFIVSCAVIYLGLYGITPLLLESGIPFFVAYLIFFHIPLFLLLITALIMYRSEGNNWNWQEFKERMYLRRMKGMDWLWAIGLFFFGMLAYAFLQPVIKEMAHISFFSPPDFFPAGFNPNKEGIPGYMMDYRLSGQYWVIISYLFAWITNILGEELLFRGIILPRQIKKYGKFGWIYHGLLWGSWHFFAKWNLVFVFPLAFAFSYTIYKRKNLWITIFVHGLMNFISVLMVTLDVMK